MIEDDDMKWKDDKMAGLQDEGMTGEKFGDVREVKKCCCFFGVNPISL